MKQYKIGIILLGGAIIRLIHLFTIWDTPIAKIPIIDSEYYHTWAVAMLNGNGGEGTVFFMSPLYPYILSFVYRIFGIAPQAMLLLQVIAGIALIYLFYLLGEKLFSEQVGIISAVTAALYRPFLYYEGVLLSAEMILILNSVALLLLIKAKRTTLSELSIGFLLGLSALARPNILLFCIIIFLYYIITPSKRDLKRALLIFAGLFLVIAPVTIRNYLVSGEVVFITAGAGMNFYAGNNPYSEGIYWEAPFLTSAEPMYENEDYRREASKAVGQELSLKQASKFWFQQGISFISSHPLVYLKLIQKKFFLFFHKTEIPNNLSIYAVMDYSKILRMIPITFALLAPLGFAGWYFFWKSKWMTIVHIYGISYIAATLMFFAASEYRLPIVIILIPLSSAILYDLYQKIRCRKLLQVIPGIVLFLLLLFPVNIPTALTHNLASSRMDYFNLGSVQLKKKHYSEAASLLQRALFLDPDFAEAHLSLADAYHALGLRDEAIEEFKRAGIDPKYEMQLLDAETNFKDAQIKAQTGDYEGAYRLYRDAINFHPNPPVSAYYNMAFLSLELGDTSRALIEIETAQQIFSHEPKLFFLLGWIYDHQNKKQEALSSYMRALQENSAFHEVRVHAARLSMELGMKSQAADLIEPLMGMELYDPQLKEEVIRIAKEVGY